MANLVHSSSTLISPLLSNIEGEATRNLSLLTYFSSLNDNPKNDMVLKEQNYLELSSDSAALTVIKENNSSLNLEATELTLGPPRSQSPEKDVGLDSPKTVTLDENKKNPLVSSHPSMDGVCSSITKTLVSGNKRAFSATIDEKSCASKSEVSLSETCQSTSQGNTSITNAINVDPPRALVQQQSTANGTNHNSNAITPTDKAEVVAGWPPVKARKNTQAASPKNNDKVDGKRALLVKVGMNGAPYLRKVDLRSYSTYQQLSSALQKMFNCFTLGTCGAQEAPGTEIRGENGLRDQKQGSKHVITYEDKDGDMMLVGDVPWEMFIESCKKLKIMKGSDAIGFGPSNAAMEKSKNKNSRKR